MRRLMLLLAALAAPLPALAICPDVPADCPAGPTYQKVTALFGFLGGPWTTATRPTDPRPGDTGFNTDLLTNETWNGVAWTAAPTTGATLVWSARQAFDAGASVIGGLAVDTVTAGLWHGTIIDSLFGGTGTNAPPDAGQILIGQGPGLPYAVRSIAGDAALDANGRLIVSGTNGNPFVTSAWSDTTDAANIVRGTLPAGRLPTPTGSTLGGVRSSDPVPHQFVTGLSTLGVPSLAQPDYTDVTGLGGMARQDPGAVDITGVTRLTGVPAPVGPNDAVPKVYADSLSVGLSIHTAAMAATTGVLPFLPDYNNGTAGLGATLTAGSVGALTVDAFSPALNDRLIVKDQALAATNGCYTLSTVGTGSVAYVLTRCADFAVSATMLANSYFFISNGTTNGGSGYLATPVAPVTVGTTPVPFTQFSASSNSQPGAGLQKTGQVFSIATGGVINAMLASATMTINGTGCVLGAGCTPAAPAGTLSGSTLAAGVTASSLLSAAGGTFGTAAFAATGTSGHALAFLDAVGNTWSGGINLSGAIGATKEIGYKTVGSLRWTEGMISPGESTNNQGAAWTLDSYSDAGSFIGRAIGGHRASGPFGTGGPELFALSPYTQTQARAVSPGGIIGNFQSFSSGDVQPTAVLGTNPLSSNGTSTLTVSWTNCCGATSGAANSPGPLYLGSGTGAWANLSGATPLGGVDVNTSGYNGTGWYKVNTDVDANTFTVTMGSSATTATGGGSSVVVQPSFDTVANQEGRYPTAGAAGFILGDAQLFGANPSYYTSVAKDFPSYQARWTMVFSPPDTSATHFFATAWQEVDLGNRASDDGYCPYLYGCGRSTTSIWTGAGVGGPDTGVPSFVPGGGTVKNWNTVYGIFGNGVIGVYDVLNIQPFGLVGAANDPTGHGGVGDEFHGSYAPLALNPYTATNGTGDITINFTGTNALNSQVNGNSIYVPTAISVAGVSAAPGNYALSNVNKAATTATIAGVGTASCSPCDPAGGSGNWVGIATLVPFAPVQFWGEWKHGITTTNFKSDDGSIINTQPGNGILWNDGVATATMTATRVSAGNINLVLTPAGTGTVLPKSIDKILYASQYATLAAAVAALPVTGGTVILPFGVTIMNSAADRITSTTPNVHLVGQGWGTVLRRNFGTGASWALVELRGAGSVAENFTVDGNSVVHNGFDLLISGTGSLARHIQSINIKGAGGISVSGEGTRLTDSTITGLGINIGSYGVWALNHNQVTIDHNTVSGTGKDCIGFNSNPNGPSLVTDNHVSNCHNITSEQGGAIAYYDVGGSPSKGAVISHNTVVGGGILSDGIEADAEGAIISDNDISGCGVFGVILFGAASNSIVSDNRIRNCAQTLGVAGIAVHRTVAGHFEIKGNRVWTDDGVSLMNAGIGIAYGSTDNFTIADNDLSVASGAIPLLDGSTGTNKIVHDNDGVDNVIPTVASAATLILPLNSRVKITGATTVTTLTATPTTFTGSITGVTLTVSGVSGPGLAVGQLLYGADIPVGETITAGSGTTWTVSPGFPTPVSAEAMFATAGYTTCWKGRTIKLFSDSATPFTATGNIANAFTLTANGVNEAECDGTNWHIH